MDISVSAKSQYDKANAGQYNKVNSTASECNPISSPSLADGVRGWVNPTSAFQTKSATAIKGSTSSLPRIWNLRFQMRGNPNLKQNVSQRIQKNEFKE